MHETLTGAGLCRIAHVAVVALAATIAAAVAASRAECQQSWPPAASQPCPTAQFDDPNQVFARLSREESVATDEVIVEGVIESYSLADHTSDVCCGPDLILMRVEKVWKGSVSSHVILETWLRRDCVLIGKHIRFGAAIDEKNVTPPPYPELRQLQGTKVDFLSDWDELDLPLRDPELDRLLDAYRAKTKALEEEALAGGRQARLAYAEHLRANGETHRAFEVYDALLRENPNDFDLLLILAAARTEARFPGEPEATLSDIEQRAPKTEEWRNKIVRARFAATGLLTSDGKDWSDVKRTGGRCYSDRSNFDAVVFDRSDFSNCAFRYSSFRGASFRGTDLTGSYFQNSDLTGAKYDCTTKLPDDLDPIAAGMVNVQGSCTKQP